MKISKQKSEKIFNILNSIIMNKQQTATKVATSPYVSFSAKKIGANIIVIGQKQDGTSDRLSRKVTKEEAEVISKKIALFNKKPSEATGKAIVKLTTPEAAKKQEEKETNEVKVKSLAKKVKQAAKQDKSSKEIVERKNVLEELEELLTNDETAVERIEVLLKKFKKVEDKVVPAAVPSSYRRPGEN